MKALRRYKGCDAYLHDIELEALSVQIHVNVTEYFVAPLTLNHVFCAKLREMCKKVRNIITSAASMRIIKNGSAVIFPVL